MSLYQLYRPKKFSEVINQDVIVETLKNSITHNLIGHVYIFSGPKGTGKTTIAKLFSKAVNCQSFTNDVCNACENCQLIDHHDTTDILELDAASNNGVEDIRNILETVKFLPNSLKYKVYIIDEAHMLSNSAWNALLKTLEEPNEQVIFIFATTEMHKIPATIISRCQCFEFHRLTTKQLVDLATKVCTEQKIKISKLAMQILVATANGSARDLLSRLEQAAIYTNNDINENDVDRLFGLVSVKNIINLLQAVFDNDVPSILQTLDSLEERGVDFCLLTNNLANILLDKIIYSKTNDINLLKILTEDTINSFSIDRINALDLIDACQKSYYEIKNSDQPRFNFEILLFNLVNLAHPTETKTPIKKEQSPKEEENPVVSEDTGEPEPQIDMSSIFHIGLVQKNEPKPNVVEKVTSNDDQLLTKVTVQILNNATKEATIRAKQIFDEIKKKADTPVFQILGNALRVSLASKNGIIFLFNDKLDAELLNQHLLDGKLQQKLIRISSQPMYLVGITNAELKDLAQSLSQYSQSDYHQEPDISVLRKILTKTDIYSQVAFEQFEQE